jgi:hypothetical protein
MSAPPVEESRLATRELAGDFAQRKQDIRQLLENAMTTELFW